MPSGTDPTTPRSHHRWVVHMQHPSSGSAVRSQPDDLCLTLVPGKMVTPLLLHGGKSGTVSPVSRIDSSLSCGLGDVARETGQTQVVRCGEPAGDLWNSEPRERAVCRFSASLSLSPVSVYRSLQPQACSLFFYFCLLSFALCPLPFDFSFPLQPLACSLVSHSSFCPHRRAHPSPRALCFRNGQIFPL